MTTNNSKPENNANGGTPLPETPADPTAKQPNQLEKGGKKPTPLTDEALSRQLDSANLAFYEVSIRHCAEETLPREPGRMGQSAFHEKTPCDRGPHQGRHHELAQSGRGARQAPVCGLLPHPQGNRSDVGTDLGPAHPPWKTKNSSEKPLPRLLGHVLTAGIQEITPGRR